MAKKCKFCSGALAEYVVGLYASGLLGRIAGPPVAIAIAAAFLVGLCDAITGWQMAIPLWARIVSALTFFAIVAVLIAGHIRRTREIGRRALSQGTGA